MQKWEYCKITGLSGKTIESPCLYRMTDKGMEIITQIEQGNNALENEDIAGQLIAYLGNEGWEMIGAGNTSEYFHCIYFKRPKTDSRAEL